MWSPLIDHREIILVVILIFFLSLSCSVPGTLSTLGHPGLQLHHWRLVSIFFILLNVYISISLNHESKCTGSWTSQVSNLTSCCCSMLEVFTLNVYVQHQSTVISVRFEECWCLCCDFAGLWMNWQGTLWVTSTSSSCSNTPLTSEDAPSSPHQKSCKFFSNLGFILECLSLFLLVRMCSTTAELIVANTGSCWLMLNRFQ